MSNNLSKPDPIAFGVASANSSDDPHPKAPAEAPVENLDLHSDLTLDAPVDPAPQTGTPQLTDDSSTKTQRIVLKPNNTDPIVIHPRPAASKPTSQIAPHMELIEGDSGATQEQINLVRARLQVAGPALGFGFFIFAVWIWIREFAFPLKHFPVWVLGFHRVTTIALIGVSIWLACVKNLSHFCLVSAEAVIFGLPAIFFGVSHYYELVLEVQNFALISTMPTSSWVILIFAYAIFLPNSWRRVLSVVLAMAALPVIATVYAIILHPDVRTAIFYDPSSTIEMLLLLAATIFAAVSGVRMITSLRSEASEAKQLGRYRLKEKIGSGGMGDVFLAEHMLMKRPCAIKVIRPEKAGDPRALARFEREVQATAQLAH